MFFFFVIDIIFLVMNTFSSITNLYIIFKKKCFFEEVQFIQQRFIKLIKWWW